MRKPSEIFDTPEATGFDRVEQYECRSYYDGHNNLHDCTCGKCGVALSPTISSDKK